MVPDSQTSGDEEGQTVRMGSVAATRDKRAGNDSKVARLWRLPGSGLGYERPGVKI